MTPGLRQLEAEQKRRKLLQEKGVGRAKLRETREISCKQATRLERASNSICHLSLVCSVAHDRGPTLTL